MEQAGSVKIEIKNGIGEICFSHPKANCLPSNILSQIKLAIQEYSEKSDVKLILLRSGGAGAFCGGASFDELKSIQTEEDGRRFFLGFADLLLAIQQAKKFVVARVHGKVVGGGVGIVAACDYALATSGAAIRLSELELGLGPFTIGPAVERKIGKAAFSTLSIDCNFRDSAWAERFGLYADVFATESELDLAVGALLARLGSFDAQAMAELKGLLWQDTEHWKELLPRLAGVSAKLWLKQIKR